MAETLRELVVALSLDSNNFSQNMRTIAPQIKEAESAFNLVGAGIDKFDKSLKGNEAGPGMQKSAAEPYARALEAAGKTPRENAAVHSPYTGNSKPQFLRFRSFDRLCKSYRPGSIPASRSARA